MTMPYIELKNIGEKEIVKGFHARMAHSENMTFAFWRIEKGAELPAHSHVHEQAAIVLEGELELVVNGIPQRLTPGTVYVIPSNVPHGGKAIKECRVLDVFYPVREDYR
jgi:quercetin dioxygenase-like cupin family protein